MKKENSPSNGPVPKGRLWILLIAGLLAGGSIIWFLKPEKIVEKPPVETVKPMPGISRKFINSQAVSPEYRNHDPRELKGIKNKMETLIAKQKATTISIYFRDLTNDQWFGIHETETFSPASLLKVPVMIAVLRLEDESPGILSKSIYYDQSKEHNYKKPVNARSSLIAGNNYSVDQLIHIMITESDNEATILLMKFLDQERPGFRKQVEKDLGFVTPDDVNLLKDFVTVRRYSAFFRSLYNASYLSEAMSEKALTILSETGFGYGIRKAIPSETVVSHKYGYRQVDRNMHQYHHFGIVYHPKKPFLVGIMTKGHNPENLKEIITLLSTHIYQEVDNQTISPNGYLQRDLD